MENVFLCFFGDGALWDNTILTTAFPNGFSYHRPFRYRDTWIGQSILKEIANFSKRPNFYDKNIVLAMRFLSETHKWLLLPIRQVQITHIDYIPDNQSIYFKFGPMVDFGAYKNLSSLCLEIPHDEQHKENEKVLFLRSSVILPDQLFMNDLGSEDSSWVSYTNLIANEQALPIREEAKRSIFIRFSQPMNVEIKKPVELYRSHRMGSKFGANFVEGSDYEIVFLHRVPALLGTHTTIGRVTMNYEAPTGNIELSHTEEDYNANYQTHVLNIKAVKPSGTWEEIILKNSIEAIKLGDGSLIHTVKLQIPIKVSRSAWYRFKTVWIYLLFLFIMLSLSGFLKHVISRPGSNINLDLFIIEASLAALTTILIYKIKQ